MFFSVKSRVRCAYPVQVKSILFMQPKFTYHTSASKDSTIINTYNTLYPPCGYDKDPRKKKKKKTLNPQSNRGKIPLSG